MYFYQKMWPIIIKSSLILVIKILPIKYREIVTNISISFYICLLKTFSIKY